MSANTVAALHEDVVQLLDEVEAMFRRGGPRAVPDERRYVRYEFVQPISVCMASADGTPLSEPFEAVSQNISLYGLGLTLDREVRQGDTLIVHYMMTEPRPRFVSMLVEVRHADARKPGVWYAGVLFRESLQSGMHTG